MSDPVTTPPTTATTAATATAVGTVDLERAIAGYVGGLVDRSESARQQAQRDAAFHRRMMVITGILVSIIGLGALIAWVIYTKQHANDGVLQIDCRPSQNNSFVCFKDRTRVTLRNPFVTQVDAAVSDQTSSTSATGTLTVYNPPGLCTGFVTGSANYLHVAIIPSTNTAGSPNPNSGRTSNMDIGNVVLSADPLIQSELDQNWVTLPTTGYDVLVSYSRVLDIIRIPTLPVGWITASDLVTKYDTAGRFIAVPLYWTVQGTLSDNTVASCSGSSYHPDFRCIVPFGSNNADSSSMAPKQPPGYVAGVATWPGAIRSPTGITAKNYDSLTRLLRKGDIVADCAKITVTASTGVKLGDIMQTYGLIDTDMPYLVALNNNLQDSFMQGKPSSFYTKETVIPSEQSVYVCSTPTGYTAPRTS